MLFSLLLAPRVKPLLLTLLAALTIPASSSSAADGTWLNLNGGDWGTAANWAPAAGGIIADGAGFTALFNVDIIDAPRTINLDTSRIIGNLRIGDSNASNRRSFTLSTANSSTLTFDNTPNASPSSLVQLSNSNGDTISVPVLLNNSLNITNGSTIALTLSGTLSAGTAGLKTITTMGTSFLNQGATALASSPATGPVTISGIISDGAGQVAIVHDSPGGTNLTLSGVNTFTGGVTLNEGTLTLTNANSLGSTTAPLAPLVINGGMLNVTTTGLTFNNAVNWNGDFTYIGSQRTTHGGAITMGKDITLTAASNQYDINGSVSDGGNAYKLTKNGAGTLFLANTVNTYTGGTVVEAGKLVVRRITSLGGTGRNVLVTRGASLSMVTDPLDQAFLNRIDTSSVGFVGGWGAITISNNLDLSALPNMILGSASGTTTYSGAITPSGNTFKFGGSSGTTTVVSSALTGAGRSLEAGVKGLNVGNVTLSGNNTYDGNTTLHGPITFQLSGNTGKINDASNIVITGNSTFRYDNTGAAAAINETVANLQLQSGDATILSQRTANFDTALTFTDIVRSTGATANFTVGGTGSTTALNKVSLTNAPTAGAFMNQGLFVTGVNYAAYDTNGFIRALAYGVAGDANTATVAAGATMASGTDTHVDLTGAISAQTTDSIRTLRVATASDVTLAAGATLTISEGGILKTGASISTISGGVGITTGSKELIIRTDAGGDTLNLNANILATSTGGLTKSGAGVLVLGGNNNYTGQTTLNAGTLRTLGAQTLGDGAVVINGGTLDLRGSGANNSTPEAIVYGNSVTVNGDSTIMVNNLTNAGNIRNKTIQMGDLNIGGNTLTVTTNNGYGLAFTGTTTLTPNATGNATLSISNATASPFVQGLTLSGKVTGTSHLNIRGSGTVQLTNSTNDFTGNIYVIGGVLAASSDGALGNLANEIKLTESTGSSTFRAIDTFSTSRSFYLGNNVSVNNIIQVVAGKTFTLNSAFQGNNGFQKADNGTFEINANNANWDGHVIIHDGVVKVSHSAALGSTAGSTWVNNQESALHLNGGAAGITIAEDLYLLNNGVGNTGAVYSLAGAGANTITGKITLNGAAAIGVETGGTLNITSATPITGDTTQPASGLLAGNFAFTLTGGGNGTLATAIATGANTLTKLGTGTWNLTATNTFTGATIVNDGTLILSGSNGKLSAGSAVQISPGATVVLDNRNGHLDNRLGTRGVHLGGNLTLIGDASAPTIETITSSNLVSANTAGILTLDADSTQSLTFQVNGGSFTRSAQGTVLYRGDNLGNAPGAGVATMKAATAPTFVGQTGTANTTNRGILSWALVDQSVTGLGQGFATYDATNGIRLLNASEQLSYLHGTVNGVSNLVSNVRLTEDKGALASYVVNSLNLANGGGIELQPLTTLHVESGGILATAGNGGINGGILQTSSNRELIVHALANTEINSVIANTSGGLTKTAAGTLTLGASNLYTGATTINQGTLKLAGGNHTILAGQALNVNTGGTLDLNGTTQYVGSLRSLGSGGGEAPQAGGTITSTGGPATLVTNNSATGSTPSTFTFAGQLAGAVNLVTTSTNTTNPTVLHTFALTNNNTYTGSTLINGGITSIRNGGRISSTSGINIQYGALRLENQFLSDNPDRIANNIAINLNGGTLSLYGRAGSLTTETVGAVTAVQGFNVISAASGSNNGNTTPHGATLTLTSLTRNAANGTTINFAQSYANTSSGALGPLATSAENIVVTGGLATVNNLIGPWATTTAYFNTNALEFVGYDSTGGVGALNATGFAGYDGTVLPGSNQPNQNIRITANDSVASGGLNINSLNIVGTSPVLSFAAPTAILNLTSGALAVSQGSGTASLPVIGSVANEGRITAGGTSPTAPVDLFIHYQNASTSNALTINAAIVDNPNNGGQPLRLIVSGSNFGKYPVTLASNLNSYSGGTIVNGSELRIGNATSAGNLVGGGLTLNGSNVVQVNGTIAQQDVTLNGPSVLTLLGTNTLNNLTFNNNGGANTNPTINLGTTLNMSGDIAVTSSNVASTATIAGGTLNLNGSSRTINVAAISHAGAELSPEQAALNITSIIAGGATEVLNKTGTGFLHLGGVNTFTGGVNLQQGGLVIGNDAALGTNTLTIGSNTTITADGTARAVANAITVSGNFTMGVRGPVVPAALTLSGAVNWGAANRQVTVNSNPATAQTISGVITGGVGSGITKTGIGTLTLTGANGATLDWRGEEAITVNEGTLRINSDNALGMAPASATANNIVLNNGALSASATMTLNASRGIALGEDGGSGTGIIEVVTNTHTLTYAGVITNNGSGSDSLLKTGAGNLTLNNASTYTGNTTIAAGTLALGANGALNNSEKITVVTGATFNVAAVTGGYQLKLNQTLEGGGTISGAFTAQGGSIIAPGTSVNHEVEKLTFSNSLTFEEGSNLDLQLTGATFISNDHFGNNNIGSAGYLTYISNNAAGQKEHDQVSVAGTLVQEDGAQMRVFAEGFVPQFGQIFNLLDWTTAFTASTNLGLADNYRTGASDSGYDLDLPDISSFGLLWDIASFTTHGVVVVVPEPSRMLLLAIAGIAAIGIRRRRRHSAAIA